MAEYTQMGKQNVEERYQANPSAFKMFSKLIKKIEAAKNPKQNYHKRSVERRGGRLGGQWGGRWWWRGPKLQGKNTEEAKEDYQGNTSGLPCVNILQQAVLCTRNQSVAHPHSEVTKKVEDPNLKLVFGAISKMYQSRLNPYNKVSRLQIEQRIEQRIEQKI